MAEFTNQRVEISSEEQKDLSVWESLANNPAWLKDNNGKYALIYAGELKGIFKTWEEARGKKPVSKIYLIKPIEAN